MTYMIIASKRTAVMKQKINIDFLLYLTFLSCFLKAYTYLFCGPGWGGVVVGSTGHEKCMEIRGQVSEFGSLLPPYAKVY